MIYKMQIFKSKTDKDFHDFNMIFVNLFKKTLDTPFDAIEDAYYKSTIPFYCWLP